LAAETRLIASAQHALRARAPRKALRMLSEHARRFPNGKLAEERDAARVLALCELSARREAAAALQRFRTRWPGSPLMIRLDANCGFEAGE
jgi:hypothetical protein